METAKLVQILGGERKIGAKINSSSDLIPVVRQGFKYQSLTAVIAETGLAKEDVLKVIALSPRTLARRQKEKRLTPIESDRVYRLARIVALVEEVFGDKEKSRAWLMRKNRALRAIPLELLDTDEGARQVEAVLGRIEHGVFS